MGTEPATVPVSKYIRIVIYNKVNKDGVVFLLNSSNILHKRLFSLYNKKILLCHRSFRLREVSLSAQGLSRKTNKRASAKSPAALKRDARVEPLV